MKDIKCISKAIDHNIREAREKICKAYELKDRDRPYADWLRDMAKAHLDFNVRGHEIVAKKIAEFAASGKASELTPGMKAIYEDMHADMIRDAAEVQAMIAGYK